MYSTHSAACATADRSEVRKRYCAVEFVPVVGESRSQTWLMRRHAALYMCAHYIDDLLPHASFHQAAAGDRTWSKFHNYISLNIFRTTHCSFYFRKKCHKSISYCTAYGILVSSCVDNNTHSPVLDRLVICVFLPATTISTYDHVSNPPTHVYMYVYTNSV